MSKEKERLDQPQAEVAEVKPETIFLDDDERRLEVDCIVNGNTPEDRAEALADVLSNFWLYLKWGKPDLVQDEIYRLISFTFQQSSAYPLAVKFYANRYMIKGEANLDRVLRDLIERKLVESRPGESEVRK